MSRALKCIRLCPNLKTVWIEDTQITDKEFIKFAKKDLPKLETLTIKSWGLPRDEEEEEWDVDPDFFASYCAKGLTALAASRKLPNLRVLNLDGISPGYGIKTLAESKNFPKLKTLNIRDGEIWTQAFRVFISSPNFSKLETLDLSSNNIKNIQELAESKNFPQLKVLNLSNNPIKDIKPLAESKNFPHLRVLKLTCLKEGCIQSLANSPNFPQLKRLDIYDCVYSLADIEMLMNSPNYPHLKHIGIRANQEQVQLLSQSPNFFKLRIKPPL